MVKRVLTAVLKCYMGYNTEFSDNINSSIREIHSLIARNRIKKYKKVVIMVQWPRKGNDDFCGGSVNFMSKVLCRLIAMI